MFGLEVVAPFGNQRRYLTVAPVFFLRESIMPTVPKTIFG